jgi:moderate conductance mechanosensitive channel
MSQVLRSCYIVIGTTHPCDLPYVAHAISLTVTIREMKGETVLHAVIPLLVVSNGVSTGEVFADVERPLSAWIARHTDSTVLLWASENMVEPLLRISVIVVLAVIALRLVKRSIRRAVARAQDPAQSPGQKLRSRMTFLDDAAQPQFSMRRALRADSMGALASSVASFIVWIMALFMVLGTFGVNLAPLIAGAGIVGIALGFGAQDLVKDFISGVSMLLEDQYGVGDIIDAGEASGVVEGITLRTTKIRDVTGTLWHVPNGEIRRIGNMSQEWARALLDVGVSYGTDIDRASTIILQVATDMANEEDYSKDILDTPEIWGVQALANSSVDIRLVVKTHPGRQWAIARELRRRIKIAFDAAHVEIPFPQQTVWLRTEAPVALGDAETPAYEQLPPDETTITDAVAQARGQEHSPSTDADQQPPLPG